MELNSCDKWMRILHRDVPSRADGFWNLLWGEQYALERNGISRRYFARRYESLSLKALEALNAAVCKRQGALLYHDPKAHWESQSTMWIDFGFIATEGICDICRSAGRKYSTVIDALPVSLEKHGVRYLCEFCRNRINHIAIHQWKLCWLCSSPQDLEWAIAAVWHDWFKCHWFQHRFIDRPNVLMH